MNVYFYATIGVRKGVIEKNSFRPKSRKKLFDFSF